MEKKDGFNIVSTQFSLHYFFENVNSLHGYLRNVSENCKVGGYLIGTCYDGKSIFRALDKKSLGESIFEMNNNNEGKCGILERIMLKTILKIMIVV